MGNFISLSLVAAAIFVAIDSLWLGVIANSLYKNHLGVMLREQPVIIAAALFYALFIVGLVFFVVQPALQRSSWTYALLAGAFFGLITYATYDLTNLATLKDWPVKITYIDLAWGSCISAVVSLATYHIAKWLSW